MSQIKEHLNKDYGISVQYFNNKSFIEEEKLKPEVIDQLKNNGLVRMRITPIEE